MSEENKHTYAIIGSITEKNLSRNIFRDILHQYEELIHKNLIKYETHLSK